MGFYKRCPISRTMVQFKPRLIVLVILRLWVGNSVLCYKQMQFNVLLPAAAWGGAATAMVTCEMVTNCKPQLVWVHQPQADSDCSWLGAGGLEEELSGVQIQNHTKSFLFQLGPKPPPSDYGFTKMCWNACPASPLSLFLLKPLIYATDSHVAP